MEQEANNVISAAQKAADEASSWPGSFRERILFSDHVGEVCM